MAYCHYLLSRWWWQDHRLRRTVITCWAGDDDMIIKDGVFIDFFLLFLLRRRLYNRVWILLRLFLFLFLLFSTFFLYHWKTKWIKEMKKTKKGEEGKRWVGNRGKYDDTKRKTESIVILKDAGSTTWQQHHQEMHFGVGCLFETVIVL